MKLNEFKKPQQVNELDASSILGDYGAAAVKNAAKSLSGGNNIGVANQMAKDSFIKNFINQAGETLRTGVESGLIDAEKAPETPAAASSVAAGQSTQATSTTPTTPETPEQKRIRLQKAAGQAADKEALPVSKLPGNQAQVQAANIGQQKLAKATQAAQVNMNAKAPIPAAKDTAAQAALKGRLKSGGGMASKGGSGFKNYVGGSGERMTGVDQSRAPIFKKINRENTFNKLNAVFESIVRIDEAQSIGSELQKFVTQYMRGIDLSKYQSNIQPAIDAVESSYTRDQGNAALTKLGNMLYSISMAAGGSNATSGAAPGASAVSAGTSQILSQINAVTGAEKAGDLAAIAQNALARLMKIDKVAYSNLISAIKSGGHSGKINTANMTFGGQKQDPNDPATARMMAMAKQQGKV